MGKLEALPPWMDAKITVMPPPEISALTEAAADIYKQALLKIAPYVCVGLDALHEIGTL